MYKRQLYEKIEALVIDDVRVALDTDDKNIRDERMAPIYEKVYNEFDGGDPATHVMLDEILYKIQKYVVRRWLLDDRKRVDGRRMDQIRPLAAEVGLMNRVHGSAVFTRGQTQVCLLYTSRCV